jgi:hypothetical protein
MRGIISQEWNVADAIHISWFFEENPEKRRALRIQLRQLVHWLPEQIPMGDPDEG